MRPLFFMTIILFSFVLFVKKKREINYEIYYEGKKFVKFIRIKSDYQYVSYTTLEFTMKGTIKYEIILYQRRDIPYHTHQIGQYIIEPLNLPSLKKEIIQYHKKNDMRIVRNARKSNGLIKKKKTE